MGRGISRAPFQLPVFVVLDLSEVIYGCRRCFCSRFNFINDKTFINDKIF